MQRREELRPRSVSVAPAAGARPARPASRGSRAPSAVPPRRSCRRSRPRTAPKRRPRRRPAPRRSGREGTSERGGPARPSASAPPHRPPRRGGRRAVRAARTMSARGGCAGLTLPLRRGLGERGEEGGLRAEGRAPPHLCGERGGRGTWGGRGAAVLRCRGAGQRGSRVTRRTAPGWGVAARPAVAASSWR